MDTKPPHMVTNTTERVVQIVRSMRGLNWLVQVDVIFFCILMARFSPTLARVFVDVAQVLQGFSDKECLRGAHDP